MKDLDLMRTLRLLRRTVIMLQAELRQGHMDSGLLADIDAQMERGIATEPRCADLRVAVDVVRENTMTPRRELMRDSVRACEKLKEAIDEVLDQLG